MKIIKLNAIDSTNSFLKELVATSFVENQTVVVTKEQTQGRGQVNTKWVSTPGKNLTFSMYVEFKNLKITQQRFLNYACSLSVFEVLDELNIPKLAVKWPNDILSDKKKICGILIETTFKSSTIKSAIIGVGLNVNQENFDVNLPNASSIKKIVGKAFDLDFLLEKITKQLQKNTALLVNGNYNELEHKYLNVLYKKNVPSMFKDVQNVLFMGKIIGVSQEGKLIIELADETFKEFGLKEVSFVF